jgi:hypothetical protein
LNDGKGAQDAAIAAVVADVDGTLVTSEKALTPRAIQAVHQLQTGACSSPSPSGRPPRAWRCWWSRCTCRSDRGVQRRHDRDAGHVRARRTDDPGRGVAGRHRVDPACGLYAWIYRGTEWYVTDPHAPHAGREASTVHFQPTVVPSYDGLLEGLVKIVASATTMISCAMRDRVRDRFGSQRLGGPSQLYYLDVTNPTANKGVVSERLSTVYGIPLQQIATLGDQSSDVAHVPAQWFEHRDGQRQCGRARPGLVRGRRRTDDDGFAKAIERLRPAPSGRVHPDGAELTDCFSRQPRLGVSSWSSGNTFTSPERASRTAR